MVTNALGPVYGGTTKIVNELAQSLGQKEIEVDIVTTNANGSNNLQIPLNTWIIEKTHRIQYFSRWHYSGEYKFSWSLTQWLFQNVSAYDLVHTHGLFCYPVLPVYWACRIKEVPYIIAPHGMLEPWALAHKAIKKRFYYYLFEKRALNQAKAIHLTASSEAEHTAMLNLKSHLLVIPNGVHQEDFETLANPELFYRQFPETQGKTLILFLGRIDPKKGLDLLAPAFGQARRQFPNAHLIVAGPDNIGYLPTAQAFFAQAGCLEAVTFTGMLTGDLKYAALAAASIYVAPSYSEGFSMSILEGMASGLPCIFTTGCNFPEAAAAQAAYVVNANVHKISSALTQCLKNPQAATETGNRARQFIFEHYTWNRIAAHLIEVYRAIIDKTAEFPLNYITNQIERTG